MLWRSQRARRNVHRGPSSIWGSSIESRKKGIKHKVMYAPAIRSSGMNESDHPNQLPQSLAPRREMCTGKMTLGICTGIYTRKWQLWCSEGASPLAKLLNLLVENLRRIHCSEWNYRTVRGRRCCCCLMNQFLAFRSGHWKLQRWLQKWKKLGFWIRDHSTVLQQMRSQKWDAHKTRCSLPDGMWVHPGWYVPIHTHLNPHWRKWYASHLR